MNTRPFRNLLPALALAGLALSACSIQAQPAQPTPAPEPAKPAATTASTAAVEVKIKGHDFSYEAPDQIAAGPVTFDFLNAGHEPHHAQLARLNDGVTLEQFQAALKKGETEAFPLVTFTGGPGAVFPNQSSSVTLDLSPGQYVLICFFRSNDGTPHFAKGMIRPLTVTGAVQASPPQPKADLTVRMKDFHFDLPAELKAGKQVWQIVNDGPQPHELQIIKLAPGKTVDDIAAFFQKPDGPPPFDTLGGMQGLNVGLSGWLNLNLQAGNYAALCYIPDPKTGQPHFALGMVMPFAVR